MQKTITPQFATLLSGAAFLSALWVPSAVVAGGPAESEFGCTVKRNIETQVVDMDPRYVGDLVEGGVGHRSSASVRRYMNDKIRPLIRSDLRSAVGGQGGAARSGDVSGSGGN